MTERYHRRPISNFFVKKSMQLSIIWRILLTVFLTALLTTIIVGYIYNQKSQTGSFYYMSNNITEDLQLESVLGLVLPAVIAAQLVSLMIGVGIGMFSSRRVAVPIYKIEKWASQLREGNLLAQLGFREKGELKELALSCNGVSDTYRSLLEEIEEVTQSIEQHLDEPREVAMGLTRLRAILEKIRYK